MAKIHVQYSKKAMLLLKELPILATTIWFEPNLAMCNIARNC